MNSLFSFFNDLNMMRYFFSMQSKYAIKDEKSEVERSILDAASSLNKDSELFHNQIRKYATILEQICINNNQVEGIGFIYLNIIQFLVKNDHSLNFANYHVTKALEKDSPRHISGKGKSIIDDAKNLPSFIFKYQKSEKSGRQFSKRNEVFRFDADVTYNEFVNNIDNIKKLIPNKLNMNQMNVVKREIQKLNDTIQKSYSIECEPDSSYVSTDSSQSTQLIQASQTTTSSTETKSPKIQTPTATEEPKMNLVTRKLMEVRDILNEIINQSMYYPPVNVDTETKIVHSLNLFIERMTYYKDKKHKLTFFDWAKIVADRVDSNFKTSLCAKCRELDYTDTKKSTKKIYKHEEMKLELNERYDVTKPLEDQPPYVFKCPKCKGTERKVIKITRERIITNNGHILALMVDVINNMPFETALELIYKSQIQDYRINHDEQVSRKLLKNR